MSYYHFINRQTLFQNCLLLLVGLSVIEFSCAYELGGHIKYRGVAAKIPQDSLYRATTGRTAIDHNADLRLNWSERVAQWDARLQYQMQARRGDQYEVQAQLPGSGLLPAGAPNDDRRLFDLTDVISEGDRHIRLQRLDRLSIGYSDAQLVARVGRQAITWGNGLIYTPMDIFNPFDPAAIDKEYKAGDDMLYGQWLAADGSDVQLVWVVRRDPVSDSVNPDQASRAIKYHRLINEGAGELDLLVAYHFDDPLIGVGALHNIGDAVWRSDLTLSRSDHRTIPSLVTNLSWSWIGWERNMSGVLEYFYNGYGELGDQQSLASVVNNRALADRLTRGELYTLGRHYLASSVTIEATPLLRITPNLFTNLQEPSALMQLLVEYDVVQDMQLLVALDLPLGAPGSEFSGIEVESQALPGATLGKRYLSRDANLSVQLGWYF